MYIYHMELEKADQALMSTLLVDFNSQFMNFSHHTDLGSKEMTVLTGPHTTWCITRTIKLYKTLVNSRFPQINTKLCQMKSNMNRLIRTLLKLTRHNITRDILWICNTFLVVHGSTVYSCDGGYQDNQGVKRGGGGSHPVPWVFPVLSGSSMDSPHHTRVSPTIHTNNSQSAQITMSYIQ